MRRAVVGACGLAVGAQVLPAATWLPPVRRTLAPALRAPGRADHVALTFDDGPDPESTPRFLDLLDRLDVRATFFLVGERVVRAPTVVREAAARGHDIQVHGWVHRNQLARPTGLRAQLRDTRDLLAELTGCEPRWYRPPYGVLSGEGVLACRRVGLRPVLWSAWARDWYADRDSADVYDTVRPGLRGGATILLHDTDAYAQPGSWRATLGAVEPTVRTCRDRGLEVGTLSDHGFGERRSGVGS
ncbi:polysaccharide deacetylase family protein [Rhodococcus sp. D2-41]|uniref:polysaccharide deacetylase family protein n=1 Tax=Speluncibacter jeojiensis TaxID=2710754 RepID=UPI00240EF6D2|nr:polysaccharide deacetylase family protein [Rhodococcus sp. D2-41]MDG3009583.1 polysaccharide deacetylase family protein [Rhodococcus sp. D2-41]